MQFILDHLSALLIGSGILLSLAAISHSGQMAAVDSSSFYTLKQQQLSFLEILQHDLTAAASVTSTSVDPGTGRFQLATRPDPSSAAVRQVTYEVAPVVEVDGMVYQKVVRYVDGIESGSSAPFVTGWSMQLLNGEGKPVGNAADGREIAVFLELSHPAPAEQQTVRRSTWQMTFHPPLLQRNTVI